MSWGRATVLIVANLQHPGYIAAEKFNFHPSTAKSQAQYSSTKKSHTGLELWADLLSLPLLPGTAKSASALWARSLS